MNFTVTKYDISPKFCSLGTKGSYGNETVSFTFDSSWANLTKIVSFYPADKKEPKAIILTNGATSCSVPAEMTAVQGIGLIAVQGYSNGKNIITQVVKATIDEVPEPATEQPKQPTPTLYEQLLTIAEEADATAQSVRDDADDGEFDGKDAYPISTIASASDILDIQFAVASETYSSEYAYGIVSTAFSTYSVGDLLQIDDSTVTILFNMQGTGSTIDQTYNPLSTNAQSGTAVAGAISPITEKIPAQASSSNKLADKDFVNSSIATNTAYYISNNGQPFESIAELEAYSGTLTNNDYAFVVERTGGVVTAYKRYKYNSSTSTWAYEYTLNNSSFTAVQWSAINSGITSADVTEIGNKVDKEFGKGLSTNDYTNKAKYRVDVSRTIFCSILDIQGSIGAGADIEFLWLGADNTVYSWTDIDFVSHNITLNYGEIWKMRIFSGYKDFTRIGDYIDIPTALSDLTDDATHRTVTDSEKSSWNDKLFAFDDETDLPKLPSDIFRPFIWFTAEETFSYTDLNNQAQTIIFHELGIYTGKHQNGKYYFNYICDLMDLVKISNQIEPTITLATSDWTSALASDAPYTYTASATVSVSSAPEVVELINNNAVAFATYGFAISSTSYSNGTLTINFLSIGQPSASVNLKVVIR